MLGIRLLGRYPLGEKTHTHFAAIYVALFCGLLQTECSAKRTATNCHLTDGVAVYRAYMLGIYLGHTGAACYTSEQMLVHTYLSKLIAFPWPSLLLFNVQFKPKKKGQIHN
jgi:hypothetical protein